MAVVLSAATSSAQHQTDPAGTVAYTTRTSLPDGPCGPSGFDYSYTGWYFADANGVDHTFSGSSTSSGGGNCQLAHVPTQNTGFNATSSDGLYEIAVTGSVGVVSATTTLNPAYQVVSILYAPPGNESSVGYTTGETNGSTTQFQYGFQGSNSMTYKVGSFSATFGSTTSTTNTSAFQETFNSATGHTVSSDHSNPNPINHNYDEFLIWLNPQVQVTADGTDLKYTTTLQPLISNSNGYAVQPDIVQVPAIDMEANASGQTNVPVADLSPQLLPAPAIMPGLGAFCANQTLYSQQLAADIAAINANPTNPNPTIVCTQTNQCGCTPADFATVLQTDPLLNYNSSTLTANPYPSTTNPLTLDASGLSACGTPSSTDDCRYVPVPVTAGSATPQQVNLTGPACGNCNNTGVPYTQTDATTNTQTMGTGTGQTQGLSYSVSFSWAGVPLSWTTASSITFNQSESSGTINGTNNSLTFTLNSTTQDCSEWDYVYEDTVFHTFVLMEPAGNYSCAPAPPTFSPAAGSYTGAQTVTISDDTSGVAIYYTTDGSTPTTSSTLYIGPVMVTSSETINAIAVETNNNNVSSWPTPAIYTIH